VKFGLVDHQAGSFAIRASEIVSRDLGARHSPSCLWFSSRAVVARPGAQPYTFVPSHLLLFSTDTTLFDNLARTNIHLMHLSCDDTGIRLIRLRRPSRSHMPQTTDLRDRVGSKEVVMVWGASASSQLVRGLTTGAGSSWSSSLVSAVMWRKARLIMRTPGCACQWLLWSMPHASVLGSTVRVGTVRGW